MAKTKNNYYAYFLAETNEEGIFDNWKECEKKVKGKTARYKGFIALEDAQKWLQSGAKYKEYKERKKISKQPPKELVPGIYFDAGTGRGHGVEVRITNEKKESIIHEILGEEILNQHQNYNLGKSVTNNYGELTGCLLALQLAIKTKTKFVFGDSSLVIKYWSKGTFRDEIAEDTKKLIHNVVQLRKEFENQGGKLKFISGDYNPADLGFHQIK